MPAYSALSWSGTHSSSETTAFIQPCDLRDSIAYISLNKSDCCFTGLMQYCQRYSSLCSSPAVAPVCLPSTSRPSWSGATLRGKRRCFCAPVSQRSRNARIERSDCAPPSFYARRKATRPHQDRCASSAMVYSGGRVSWFFSFRNYIGAEGTGKGQKVVARDQTQHPHNNQYVSRANNTRSCRSNRRYHVILSGLQLAKR